MFRIHRPRAARSLLSALALTAAAGQAQAIEVNDPLRPQQWQLDTLQAEQAWQYSTGEGVIVAVLDVGFNFSGPDGLANVLPGHDFCDNDDDPVVLGDAHAMTVSNMMGVRTDNGVGVAGLAPGVSILPVRWCSQAAAIDWAVAQGADIINISSNAAQPNQRIADAIARALEANVLVVTGSGNDGHADPGYPSWYEGVLSVGATDINNQLAGFSNFGPYQDFVAPGVGVFTEYLDARGEWVYGPRSGCSFASPELAGSLAMLLGAGATPDEAVAWLEATAIDLGAPGRDDYYGHGLIQPAAALEAFARDRDRRRHAADFDGDGFADLVAGAPGESLWLRKGTGEALAVYGAPGGLDPFRSDSIFRGTPGVPGSPQPGEALAAAVGRGDFDADGYTDLALGAPGRDDETGAVLVLRGGPAGLDPSTSFVLRATGGVPGDQFGAALTTGDFNHDGYTDLAVGSPGAAAAAGAVHVFYGGALGLDPAAQVLTRLNPAAGDQLGAALAAGDFDGDRVDDLAMGLPGSRVSNNDGAGRVMVMYGNAAGIDENEKQMWHQNRPGVPTSAAPGDAFGAALAAGDLDLDGRDELVVGVPGEDDAGVVQVLQGGPDGLFGADVRWRQRTGLAGTRNAGDRFGAALAVGDLNGDGLPEIAIGVPGELVDATGGAVQVLIGGPAGPGAYGDALLDGSADQVAPEADDAFGTALTMADFDADGFLDLAVGAPGALPGGIVQLFSGAADGLLPGQRMSQSVNGTPGSAEAGDAFGAAL
ncbi:MAG: FG-GAP repeat protein [Myxococcales bacterium]|nr:FG-GAP repeat protein [Myxococcales bacterium]